jgi:hypothetical protein
MYFSSTIRSKNLQVLKNLLFCGVKMICRSSFKYFCHKKTGSGSEIKVEAESGSGEKKKIISTTLRVFGDLVAQSYGSRLHLKWGGT